MALYVALVFVVGLVLLVAGVAVQRRRRRQLPPGPPSWPIIGSLHHLFSALPHRALAKISQQYGPYLFMRLGSTPTVVVSSAEIAKLFLQTHDKIFASRPPFQSIDHLSYGKGLMVATSPYGEPWRELRRLYTVQLLTAKRVKECMPIVADEIERLMTEIRGYAEAGIAFNLTEGFGSLLENIVCRFLLGLRLSQVSDATGGHTLKEALKEVPELFGTPLIGEMIPWLSFLDAKTKKKMEAWRALVDGLLERVLDARAKEEETSSNSQDFLQVLFANNLPRNNIKAIIVETLGAGIDTSSVTLDWAMAELLLNPKVMKKLEGEVEQVMGKTAKKMIEEEELTALEYSKAVIKETFRLHPPAPLLVTHMSREKCEVGGYWLPGGTNVLVNVWAIGREPQLWEHSNAFLPDRFLDGPRQVDVRGQNFELIPFGSGRRICPGMTLALPIVEMTLAKIVHSFRWSLPPPPHNEIDMIERMGTIVCRAHPLFAIPTSRLL